MVYLQIKKLNLLKGILILNYSFHDLNKALKITQWNNKIYPVSYDKYKVNTMEPIMVDIL